VLRWRLISAGAILAVLLALTWVDYKCLIFGTPGAWLLPLMLVVSALATGEVLGLLSRNEQQPRAGIVYFANLAIPLAAAWPIVIQLVGRQWSAMNALGACGLLLAAVAGCSVLVLIGEMARFRQAGSAIASASLSMFGIVYVGLLISFWALLRLHRDNEWGMLALFSMLLVVKMADAGAFAVGKLFGRHKMTPVLSPGKTWEGTIGGILTGCATSWLFFRFAGPALVGSSYFMPPLGAVMVYGLLLALAGMIGDLAESLLKRDMDRKDSSTWLPGLGGVLDIIDAPLVAGPVAWVCWTAGLVGP
jgi:phosphatidate cytidylyltransferase